MRRSLLTIALLAGCGLAATIVTASPTETAVVGKSRAPVESRMEGAQAIDDATAAALIGAISGQFDERDVQIRLEHVDVEPAGLVQRNLSGTGRLQMGEGETWIPFRFKALYDTAQSTVGYPDLTLGSVAPGRAAAIGSRMGRQLATEVDRRLKGEFASQPVRFDLASVQVVHAGSRYLRVAATGNADFGADGQTDTDVDALYDPRTGHWVRVAYHLGPGLDTTSTATVAVR